MNGGETKVTNKVYMRVFYKRLFSIGVVIKYLGGSFPLSLLPMDMIYTKNICIY